MIKKVPVLIVFLALSFAMLAHVGCAGRSQSARFYVLSPVPGAEMIEKPGITPEMAIGIHPVTLPKYLKRPQIVTRSGSTGLHLAEYDRWAGKIEEDIGRVIAENLSYMLAADTVLAYPAMTEINLDYAIKVDISRFDGSLGGNIEFIGRWAIFDAGDNMVYGVKATHLSEPSNGGSYAEMVAAQSRILAVFSKELAQELIELADR